MAKYPKKGEKMRMKNKAQPTSTTHYIYICIYMICGMWIFRVQYYYVIRKFLFVYYVESSNNYCSQHFVCYTIIVRRFFIKIFKSIGVKKKSSYIIYSVGIDNCRTTIRIRIVMDKKLDCQNILLEFLNEKLINTQSRDAGCDYSQ